jgi:natural product biosynthesis luciferase-like monooxygenase protein
MQAKTEEPDAGALRRLSDEETLISRFRRTAAKQPDRIAYSFLSGGESQAATLTYAELDVRARALANWLTSIATPGERVLLLYPPGLEFVCAFLGCLYAGVVAVPLPPPRLSRRLDRIERVAEDSRAGSVLTTRAMRDKADRLAPAGTPLAALGWLATDDVDLQRAADWQLPSLTGDTVAFLQYTSGSTRTPRGVMVNHANLLHNESMIQDAFGQNEDSIILNWLPPYHDMGLIGGVLQPLYLGATCIMMSPLAFLERPLRWLRTISEYKVTTSGGPDFAYELCASAIRTEDCAALDLSSWTVAFNGSEPVRKETMEKFVRTFNPFGFRPEAFFPCYGLAEATLLVSGGKTAAAALVKTLAADALKENRLVEAEPGRPGSRPVVASGRLPLQQQVIIVDPETMTPCADDRIGEIWLSGPSVADGYYNRPAETEQTFRARLSDTGRGPFLRTGDLGFIRDGELFVTGRLKDLIIIRGENHYPHDIEFTVKQVSEAFGKGAGAAFSVRRDGQERLVIVQEVDTRRLPAADELIRQVRQAVSDAHQLFAYAVVLTQKGSIPRTSSGKIRHAACRSDWLEGRLKVIAQEVEAASLFVPDVAPDLSARPGNVEEAVEWLTALMSAKLGLEKAAIDASQPVSSYVSDSLAAMQLLYGLESGLGVTLSMATFFNASSLREFADLVFQAAEPHAGTPPHSLARRSAECKLSRGQQALYFLHQLAPDVAAYNIAALAVTPDLPDPAALRNAFQKLVDRHPSLRTQFIAGPEGTQQRVREGAPVYFREVDATSWAAAELNERLRAEAEYRFDLENDALLRVTVYSRTGEVLLLTVIHHIVVDFWSLGLLVEELGRFYRQSAEAQLPPPRLSFSDYVSWQEDMLAGAAGERLWDYWRERLSGELPSLNLPTDRPRPPFRTYRCGSQRLDLPPALADRLSQFIRSRGATVFMSLAAVFEILLHRYSGQDDILLGALTSGRSQSRFTDVIGYFANPVVLRADFSERPTFNSFLPAVRATAIGAFEHQDYPFPLLVEKLQPARDLSRPPLVQAMFFYQKAHLAGQDALAHLAAGESGVVIHIGDLAVEVRLPERAASEFDLTLKLASTRDGLGGTLEYNLDLFDAATMARLAGHFLALTEGCLLSPDVPVSDLPMLSEAEREQLLREWNRTHSDYPETDCVHTQIEAQAAVRPDAIALLFKEEQVSYGALNARANQVAHYLVRLGVGPEQRVGLCVRRSPDMVIGLLAILKAGGAYVPLDPTYPAERLALVMADSGARIILTQHDLADAVALDGRRAVCLDADRLLLSRESEPNAMPAVAADNLAYVIYTSGSTGKPKGVMVTHRNVVNLFHAMDLRLGGEPEGYWLAVTSISFDISVLELLWTLARGFHVVIHDTTEAPAGDEPRCTAQKPMEFSLFYFASDDREVADDRYRLLFEGAKFADQNGFVAVWTPERHFHPFGGLYPNPSVTGAAVAAVTRRVGIRAGSVVLPLHNPIRAAEEWSVVDNISKGRVGISIASGWHADDFILAPQNYAERKQVMLAHLDTLRRLWRGEAVTFQGGAGNQVEAKIFPRPVQRELPIWITAAGSPETFQLAGEIGANLLTHLLGQDLEQLAANVSAYRRAWQAGGHGHGGGHVTLMIHTFIGDRMDEVRELVRGPFCSYLKSSYGLIKNLARSLAFDLNADKLSDVDMDALLSHAFNRYFETSGLMGTMSNCRQMVERLQAIGVDEMACLIDFGVPADVVLDSLRYLRELKRQTAGARAVAPADYSIPALIKRHGVTHFQCTPSLARMLSHDAESLRALPSLKKLLLGGEALPLGLARELDGLLGGDLHNMYGPTETTVWSLSERVARAPARITIGHPIANTQAYVLDRRQEPTPINVVGVLHLAGAGVARGYANSPDLTAASFVPDPFGGVAGSRLYVTGDLTRYLPGGEVEFIGRPDQQIKLRGHRIELGEIEAMLERHPAVRQAAVVVRDDSRGNQQTVAYVVMADAVMCGPDELRDFLKRQLPEYMIPTLFVELEAMPLTPNGKIYRRGLPPPAAGLLTGESALVPPRTALEHVLVSLWADMLGVDEVGIHDDFFKIGGHSLLAAQLLSRLRETFEIDLPLRSLLQAPTVAELAEAMSEMSEQRVRIERIADLMISVAACSDEEAEARFGNPPIAG